MLNVKCVISLFSIFVSFSLLGQSDRFSFGDITLRGTGCPAGTTSVTRSPDNQALSIIFDQLLAEVPQYNGNNDNGAANSGTNPRERRRNNPKLDHKVCNIIINASIKPGERVEDLEVAVDFRGATLVEKGTMAKFKSVVASWKGPRSAQRGKRNVLIEEVWNQPIDDEWALTESMEIPIRSKCAIRREKKIKVALRNVLVARMRKNMAENSATAFLSLDTADLLGSMKVKIKTVPCSGPQKPLCGPGKRWHRKREICVPRGRKLGRKMRNRKCGPRRVWHPRKRKCVKRRNNR